ncbi:ankyrin, partial [Colletotrichum sublineola]
VEAQGQALIEAARKDQKSCLQILITSRSCNLNFNDTYVQAAMQAACSCGHDDLFKILLDAVLALTPQGHTESRQEEAFGETLREKSPKGDEEVTVGSSTSQEPMHWLISPLKRASYLGLADIVSKLLALHLALLIDAGANLNAVTNPECFTPLHLATMGGAQVVQLLLGKGSSITAQSRFGLTPLLSASAWGCAPAIEALLQHRNLAEHVPHDTREQPLAMAARGGFYRSVETLLQYRADPNQPDSSGETALQYAVPLYGRTESVRILARAGVDVNSYSAETTETPLHVAIKFPETVRVLLQHGANVNLPSLENDEFRTPFDRAVRGNHVETVKIMLEEAQNAPDLTLPSTKKALQNAVTWDYQEVVALVLEAGADVNLVDENGWSLTVRLLVHAGAQLTATNKYSLTPIINVLTIGHEEAARYLITKSPGCDVNSHCGGILATPLMAVASRNTDVQDTERIKVMEYLLDRGADPTIPAGQVAYPISSACWTCSPDIVQILLDRKVSTNVSDSFGRRPIHFTCYNSLAVLDLLGVQDEDFTVEDSTGRLPLHYAVLSGQMALVKEVLLRSERVGIDVNVVDKNNWTPLMW